MKGKYTKNVYMTGKKTNYCVKPIITGLLTHMYTVVLLSQHTQIMQLGFKSLLHVFTELY